MWVCLSAADLRPIFAANFDFVPLLRLIFAADFFSAWLIFAADPFSAADMCKATSPYIRVSVRATDLCSRF